MADINEVLGKQISSVKELRNEIKRLQDSLVGLDSESQEFKSTTEKLAYAQEELTRVTSAGKKENIVAKDSIAGLEKAYKDLYKQYKLLSDEQRNSDFGKNMAKQLKDMSDKINENKLSVGNLTSNIGNYEKAITGAFQKMGISVDGLSKSFGGATSSSNIFGSSLTSLAGASEGSAAAIGAVSAALGIVIGLLAAAYAGVQQNEELQMRWNEAMAAFEPIINAVKNGLSKLGEVLVQIVEWAGKAYVKLDEIHSKFTDWLGITKDAVKTNEALKEQVKVTQSLAKAKNDLTLKERAYNVEAAKKTAEVARLREEASATENVAEKQRLLTEAKNLQAEIDQGSLEIKQEHLRILQEENELTPNSAKDNEALAQAEIDVANAEARAAQNARMFNRQLNGTKTSANGATDELKKLADEANNVYARTVTNNKTELQLLEEKYRKEKKLLEDFNFDTKLLTKQYEKEVRDIRLKSWNEQRAKESEMWNNYYDNYSRFYKNMQDIVSDAPEEQYFAIGEFLQDAADALDNFANEAKTYTENVDDAFSTLFRTIFENADLTKLSDFDYIGEILEHFLSDEDYQKAINLFRSFGEESWAALVEGMEGKVKELNSVFGLDIKNMPDVEARSQKLGQDIAETIGEGILTGLDESEKLERIDILEKALTGFQNGKSFDEMQEYIAFREYQLLEEQKNRYEMELENFKGTQEQKLTILEKYYDVVKELNERQSDFETLQLERTAMMVESLIDMTDRMAAALNTYRSSQEQLIESELKIGKIDEAEANKKKERLLKLQKLETEFSIATIIADWASGLFSIWKGFSEERGKINPLGAARGGVLAPEVLAGLNAKSLVTAISQSAGLTATAMAQISAARGQYITAKNNFEAESGGGSDIGAAATPMLIDSNGYSYYQELQLDQNEAILNKPIYVTVTDIEEGLDHKVQVTDEASF